MILKSRVKGGIMLYALLMMSLFALLLQFYLNRQLSLAQTNQSSEDSLIAYSMAIWTRDKIDGEGRLKESAPQEVEENKSEDSQGPRLFEKDSEMKEVPPEDRLKESLEAVEISKKEDTEPALLQVPYQGIIGFDQGQVQYQLKGNNLEVEVHLLSGQNFTYVFHIDGKKF